MSKVIQSALPAKEGVQSLKDAVVRELWRKGGRACVADLANDLSPPKSALELYPILLSLEQEGILRRAEDPLDPREYEEPYQLIYELSR
jgi:hypothetical protein